MLIYKASGVFNFAQGAMVLCAALTFVTLTERDVPFWLAGLITLAIMVTLAVAVERIVLRPLVNRSQITLFMATLGLSYIIEGGSQFVMGAASTTRPRHQRPAGGDRPDPAQFRSISWRRRVPAPW